MRTGTQSLLYPSSLHDPAASPRPFENAEARPFAPCSGCIVLVAVSSASPIRVFRTCHLCEAMCGLTLTVDHDRVMDIRGDTDDVFSRGHICPKALALREIHDDPDRLRHPVRRTASGWQQVTWGEALDEAAQR